MTEVPEKAKPRQRVFCSYVFFDKYREGKTLKEVFENEGKEMKTLDELKVWRAQLDGQIREMEKEFDEEMKKVFQKGRAVLFADADLDHTGMGYVREVAPPEIQLESGLEDDLGKHTRWIHIMEVVSL